jgi:hypothetical protein
LPLRRKATVAALLAAAALADTAGPAAAGSALAVDAPADVAEQGYAYDFAVNIASDEANARAMRDCSMPSPSIDPRAQRLGKRVQRPSVTMGGRVAATRIRPTP